MRVPIAKIGVMAAAFACAACAEAPAPEISQINWTLAADNPYCRDYTAVATTAAVQEPVAGRACLQPDGSWFVTEGPPGEPPQYTAVWPPAPYPSFAYYPYYDPWFWDPWYAGFGLAFVDFRHHHHNHHHHDHGHHDHGHHGGGHRG